MNGILERFMLSRLRIHFRDVGAQNGNGRDTTIKLRRIPYGSTESV